MTLSLTCDRQDNLWRVAVWQGKELRDLYVDRIDKPDMTGAIVAAKVDRLTTGNKAAWCDAGDGLTVYVEKPGAVRSGDVLALRIANTARQGKAWGGMIADQSILDNRLGLIVNPPRPWERALNDLKNVIPSSLVFSDCDDLAACRQFCETQKPELLKAFQPLSKTPHPALDDIIEGLSDSTVTLPGGASLVIEGTEALTAIDVNAGEAGNVLDVNLKAVKETARQIRLRNVSGIIVIDALKMKLRPDNAKVLNAAERAVVEDPAGVNVYGLTKLGLIELTRQRRGPSLNDILRNQNTDG